MSDTYIAPSKIQGVGLFAGRNFEMGENICIAFNLHKYIRGFPSSFITKEARKVNHSLESNSRAVTENNIYWNLIALRPIRRGEEITSNYHDTPPFIKKDTKGYR